VFRARVVGLVRLVKRLVISSNIHAESTNTTRTRHESMHTHDESMSTTSICAESMDTTITRPKIMSICAESMSTTSMATQFGARKSWFWVLVANIDLHATGQSAL
jgi:hypothetical protein